MPRHLSSPPLKGAKKPPPLVRRIAAALGFTLGLASAITLCAGALIPALAEAKSGPAIQNFSAAFVYSLAVPNLDPRGANDFTCKPSAAHPRPVVLLHGSFANRFNSFAGLAPALKSRGYCVFAPDYGVGPIRGLNGYTGIRASSRELATYVDRVLAATSAEQVDVVGYSQGGLVARAYLKYDGGSNPADPAKNKVAHLIGLSSHSHGTDLGHVGMLAQRFKLSPLIAGALGQGAADQLIGSSFITALNAGSETAPGVDYTMVATITDEVSSPYQAVFLKAGPGAAVHNITLQAGCLSDLSDHFNITYSRRTLGLVLKALDPALAGRPPCQFLLPGL